MLIEEKVHKQMSSYKYNNTKAINSYNNIINTIPKRYHYYSIRPYLDRISKFNMVHANCINHYKGFYECIHDYTAD